MPEDNFELVCDRLSSAVDGVQFERLRWARTEGPMLARLVELTLAAIEARSDYELTEEGSRGDTKRFVLKVHGTRVVAISAGLDAGRAVMAAEAIDRSRFWLASSEPIAADYAAVDHAWITNALGTLLGRIQA